MESLHHQESSDDEGSDPHNFHDPVDSAVRDIAAEIGVDGGDTPTSGGKSKRLCRFPGCTRVIKSQGHCQRHGAKAKRCRIEGCEKQAQGTHDGMCKRHWKSINFPEEEAAHVDNQPPPAEGDSVYDHIIPASIAFRPGNIRNHQVSHGSAPAIWDAGLTAAANDDTMYAAAAISHVAGADPMDPPRPPPGSSIMPLVSFLQRESHNEPGWHRNGERRARGMFLVTSLSQQLEPWERQLALVEILLLSGGTPYANFKDLAHAWGREKGFHTVLVSSICERRGEVERKRRSDAGKTLSDADKATLRAKQRAKRNKQEEEDDGDRKRSAVVNHRRDGNENGDGQPRDSALF